MPEIPAPPKLPITRPLGGLPAAPGESLAPGPAGPVTPPLSSRYEVFQSPYVPTLPPEFEAMRPQLDPAVISSYWASKTQHIQETAQSLPTVHEQERLRTWMQQVQSSPIPANPVQWPDYAKAITSMLDTIPTLIGAPHEDMKALLLEDHTQSFMPIVDPNVDPTMYAGWAQTVPTKLAEAQWARGVVDEARRVGLDPKAEAAGMLPAPPPLRIQALAKRVLQKDPNAAVGPPEVLLNAAPEVREGVRPIQTPPAPRKIELLDPTELRKNPHLLPKIEDFQQDPVGAVIHQQQALHTLAAGMPFVAGELQAGNTSIPIHVDAEGRLFAAVESDSGPLQVEVSSGLRPAALPAVMDGVKVKWSFKPSRVAPVAFDFDADAERLVIDSGATAMRKPQQDLWHAIQEESQGKSFVDPRRDPIEFLNQVFEVDLPTSYEAKNLVTNAELLARSHRAKFPEIYGFARQMAGPNPSKRDIHRTYAELLREWFAMGAVVEMGRTAAEWRLASVENQEELDDPDPARKQAAARRAQLKQLKWEPEEIMSSFYNSPGALPYQAKPWRKLRQIRPAESSLLLAQKIVAAPMPPIEDWNDPERREEVEARLVSVWGETIRARLSKPNNGLDWYTDGVQRGLDWARVIFPDLSPTDEEIFKVFLAITSNGRSVNVNYKLAIYALQQYLATGQAPTTGPYSSPEAPEGWGGMRSQMASAHMTRFNGLLAKFGSPEATMAFLLSRYKMGERNNPTPGTLSAMQKELRDGGAWGVETGQVYYDKSWEPADTVHGAHLFGPKLGSFMLNLLGVLDWPTMDMWVTRDFHRVMGLAPIQENNQGRLVPVDDPSPAQRDILYGVFQTLEKRLQKASPGITAAQIQSVLWFAIKDLYARAGAPRALGKTENYGHAGELHAKEYQSKKLHVESLLPFGMEEAIRVGEPSDGSRYGRLVDIGGRDDPRKAGLVTLEHWSDKPGLSEISPEFAGTGPVRGAERRRGAKNVYFYFGGTTPERGLGSHKYTTTVRAENLYDLGTDSQHHWNAVAPDIDTFEENLKAMGYLGYWNSRADGEPYNSIVVMLGPVDVLTPIQERVIREVQSPNFDLSRVLRLFMQDQNEPFDERPIEVPEIDHKLLMDLSKLHEASPHMPEQPETIEAYQVLKEHTLGLWSLLQAEGFRVEPWGGDGVPYPNLAAMRADVARDKHLYFLPIERQLPPDHPMSEVAAAVGTEHGLMVEVNYDDLFRAIHFLVGYVGQGNQFTDRGAIKAFLAHSRMVPVIGRGALATETIMRHAWESQPDKGLQQTNPAKAYVTPLNVVDRVRQAFTDYLPLEQIAPEALFAPPEQIAQTIWQKTMENGGSSLRLPDGAEPTGGFMVGTSPAEQRAVVVPKAEFTPATVLSAILNNVDVLGHPNVYLGTWVDPRGEVWIEPSENVLDVAPDVALDLARRRNQQAIWDVTNQKEISSNLTIDEGPNVVQEQMRLPYDQEIRHYRATKQLAQLDSNQLKARLLDKAFPELWPKPERPKGDIIGLLFDPEKLETIKSPHLVNLAGRKVRSPRDVAVAALASENPVFEVLRFHILDLDDQEVVTSIATSSFLPFTSGTFPKEPGVISEDPEDYNKLGDEFMTRIGKFAQALGKERGGHQMALIAHHNHPARTMYSSSGDRGVHSALKRSLPSAIRLLPSLITDGDTALFFDDSGDKTQVSLGAGAGLRLSPEAAEIPHAMLGKRISTSEDLQKAGEATQQDQEDFVMAVQEPKNFAVILYVDNASQIRMIERKYNLREDWPDAQAIGQHVESQGKKVGTSSAFIYTPNPSEQLDTVVADALESAVGHGYIKDVVTGTSSWRAKLGLHPADRDLQIVMSAATTRIAEEKPGYKASLRAEALAAAATAQGFKGSRGKVLFEALTDDEKFAYTLARMSSSAFSITSDEHLKRLNPKEWVKRDKYPSYFGSWKPTPEQIESIHSAWEERSRQFHESQKINKIIEDLIALERRGKVTSEPILTIEQALDVDQPTLDKWAEDEPDKFEWWVRQFLPVFDPVRSEVMKTVKGQRRETSLRKLDKLREMTLSLVEGQISAGPHQTADEAPSPYNGIVVRMINARSAKKAAGVLLRRMGRPSTVMSGVRQGDHPIDIRDDIESGKWQQSLYQILWQGDFKSEQATLDTHQEFDLLARAAAASPELDRKIFTAMEFKLWKTPEVFDRPDWQVPPIKIGLKKTTLDLKEWLPKLGKKYEEIIDQAEESAIFKLAYDSAQYRTDLRWVRNEMQVRELLEANKGFDDGHPWEGDDWNTIPSDLLLQVRKRLRMSMRKVEALEEHNRIAYINGDPVFLGHESYRSLYNRHQVAKKGLEKARAKIEEIKKGNLRKEGYITHIHRLSVDDVRKSLMDVYSLDYRHVSPDVRNYFLKHREADAEPYHSWIVSWFLYTRTMNRSIHLEPALLKARHKLASVPSTQQPYVTDLVRRLKGSDVGFDRLMNQLAFESALKEEDGVDGAIKTVTGGKIDLREMAQALEQAGQLNTRPWNRLMRGAATWSYLGLLSAIRIPQMNLTEFGFLQYELAKSPVDLPLGVLWQTEGITKSGLASLREFGTFVAHAMSPAPRWYSEPTKMGVTESVKLLLEDWRREEGFEPFQRVADVWGSLMKASEYVLRAHTYYTLKRRALWYGHDEENARIIAAQQTNHLIGAFGHRDLSPFARGAFWNPWWIFKKFPWAKTEQVAMSVRFGAARGLGILGRKLLGQGDTQLQGQEAAFRMFAPTYIPQREKGVDEPPGLIPPEPPGGGGGDQIPPVPPPETGFPEDEYPDDEQKILSDVWTPTGEHGAGYAVGARGALRHVMQLVFGVPTAIASIWYLAVLSGLKESDGDRLWDRLNPVDLSNMSEITALFWVKDVMRLIGPGGLIPQRLLYGLTAREVRELEFREKRLLYYLPMIGRAIKSHDFAEKEKNQVARRAQRALGLGPIRPRAALGLKAPKDSGEITEPGLAVLLYRLMAGGPAPPPTAPPQPTAAPAIP